MKKVKCSFNKVKKLVDKIVNDIKDKKIKVTQIVAITRGGGIPARLIAAKLDIRRIYSIGIEFYNDTKRGKVPIVYQDINTVFDRDDVVLIVDDMYESGESLKVAWKHVCFRGQCTVLAATLHIKEKSCTDKYAQVPMFFGEWAKKNDWIEYFWE